MKCPNCGTEFEGSYCPECGHFCGDVKENTKNDSDINNTNSDDSISNTISDNATRNDNTTVKKETARNKSEKPSMFFLIFALVMNFLTIGVAGIIICIIRLVKYPKYKKGSIVVLVLSSLLFLICIVGIFYSSDTKTSSEIASQTSSESTSDSTQKAHDNLSNDNASDTNIESSVSASTVFEDGQQQVTSSSYSSSTTLESSANASSAIENEQQQVTNSSDSSNATGNTISLTVNLTCYYDDGISNGPLIPTTNLYVDDTLLDLQSAASPEVMYTEMATGEHTAYLINYKGDKSNKVKFTVNNDTKSVLLNAFISGKDHQKLEALPEGSKNMSIFCDNSEHNLFGSHDSIFVYLDGEIITKINHGDTAAVGINLPYGEHKIWVKADSSTHFLPSNTEKFTVDDSTELSSASVSVIIKSGSFNRLNISIN
jgi:hypothetical protein